MDSSLELLLEQYLSNHLKPFSIKDVESFLRKAGISASKSDIVACMGDLGLVFILTGGFYISRAGAFTDELFSIKPTNFEFDSDILIQGDRCMPFVPPDIPSDDLIFIIDGQRLKRKTVICDSDEAIDKFMLYGEEYAPQYIAADPANEGMDVKAVSGELSNYVKLTGLDMAPLKKHFGFERGDRLVCTVRDWNRGVIEFFILHDSKNRFNIGETGEKRLDWYRKLEKYLLESFESIGPCSSIEEQLASVFFAHRSDLCIPECGSVEEFLNSSSRKVGIENFGVETRLWYKGKSAPAIGNWNKDAIVRIAKEIKASPKNEIHYSFPKEVLDQAVLDMYFHHKDDLKELSESLYPEDYKLKPGELETLTKELSKRDNLFRGSYNWFTDQTAGPIRKESLDLFKKVNDMLFKIDACEGDLKEFPQQELVILTQLYSHLLNILSYSYSDRDVENDSEAIMV
ncbi:MAG: hypothetical protein IJU95_05495, partial [Treponema sp.]|nr:hypothetical protein [Treponema sp.]